jgi:hypothetical protein
VWIEIPVGHNFGLLVGNNFFLPDCNVVIIDNYLNFLTKFKCTSESGNHVR